MERADCLYSRHFGQKSSAGTRPRGLSLGVCLAYAVNRIGSDTLGCFSDEAAVARTTLAVIDLSTRYVQHAATCGSDIRSDTRSDSRLDIWSDI